MEGRQLKRPEFSEASSSTCSKRQRREEVAELQSEERESESPHLPSSDLPENINVPLASRANSGPSASSTSVIGNNYYVFLSFCGKDTRNGFTDHLYHKLRDVGLPFHPNFVFKDDEKLPFGGDIERNLIDAITRSKVSIPVISENYAASEWCLRELIQIMECQKSRKQLVLPVLYKVKPYEVRELEGAFGKAFQSHMHRSKEDVKQQGPVALREAVASRIFESEKFANGREGELVKKLVQVITLERQHDFQPSLPVDLVGIDANVAAVMKLADTAISETRFIVIHGIGGVGKTTLATFIYKKLFDKFKHRSFLKDIRETIARKDMEHVQSQLISDITNVHDLRVLNAGTGIGFIRDSCKDKKVLILLDDVDRQDHLDKLIGGCNFKSGSRIIITTRDQALLKSGYKGYELKEMNHEDSLLLFGRYAFEGKQSPTKLADLSSAIVATTGGLPLALVIIGSLLRGKRKGIWIDMLKKLKKVPNKDVHKVLRISYDSLDYQEQQMFLDIACFFVGTIQRVATYLWEDLRLYPDSGLARMIELSLINCDDENKLRMHDQLRDLGRAIAFPPDKKPWDCSRLWDEEDAMKVLGRKEENGNIEALRLDKNGSSKFMERKSFERMPYLKFLHLIEVDFIGNFEDSLSELRWLEWERCPDSFKATNVHLEKLLILDLSGGFIRENWVGWSSIKMENLKVLNLSRCRKLKSTPDLSGFKSLEMLILEYCENLEEIDPSIEDAKCLVSLNLRYCHSLKKLPSQLGELKELEELLVDETGIQEFPECIKSLKKLKRFSAVGCGLLNHVPPQLGEVKGLVSLNLMACKKLPGLPHEIGKLEELQELNISETAITEIAQWISPLKKLEMLDASVCISLDRLDDSIIHLVNLSNLDLRGCIRLNKLPENIGSLVKLQELLLGGCNFSCDLHRDGIDVHLCHIPKSIGNLKGLTKLILTCTQITELPGSIEHLENLEILDVSKNKELLSLPSAISKLGKLEELDASDCEKLGGEISIDGLSSLKILRLCSTQVSSFPNAFDKLSCLEELHLRGCKKLTSLPESISKLPSLEHLDLTGCENLQLSLELPSCLAVLAVTCKQPKLPQLSHLIHLKVLTVEKCELLETMPELPPGIQQLHVSMCFELKELPSMSSLRLFSDLSLHGCSELTEIKDLKALKSLERLRVSQCSKLSKFDGLENLESLIRLVVSSTLGEVGPIVDADLVQALGKLENFQTLGLSGHESISKLDLSQLTNLKHLKVEACVNLVEIGLEGLKNLEILYIDQCKSIATLPDLLQFTNLTLLCIGYCDNLVEIKDLEGLKNLEGLYIPGCTSIEKILGLEGLERLEVLDIYWTKLKQLRAGGCVNLDSIQGLESLEYLEELDIHGCTSIATLPDISQLTNLKKLNTEGCINLVEIEGLEALENIEEVDIHRCTSIVNLPPQSWFDKLNKYRKQDGPWCSGPG